MLSLFLIGYEKWSIKQRQWKLMFCATQKRFRLNQCRHYVAYTKWLSKAIINTSTAQAAYSLMCTVGTPSSCSLTVIYHSLIKAPCVARATGSTDGSHLQTRNLGRDEERCQIWVKDLQLKKWRNKYRVSAAYEDFVQTEKWFSAMYMKVSVPVQSEKHAKSMPRHLHIYGTWGRALIQWHSLHTA